MPPISKTYNGVVNNRRPRVGMPIKRTTPIIKQPDCKLNRTSRLQQFNLICYCRTAMFIYFTKLKNYKYRLHYSVRLICLLGKRLMIIILLRYIYYKALSNLKLMHEFLFLYNIAQSLPLLNWTHDHRIQLLL